MDLNQVFGVLFLYVLGALSLVGGLYQVYQSLFGSAADLTLGRFRWITQSPAGKRVFWLVGGSLMALGGVAFVGVTTYALLY